VADRADLPEFVREALEDDAVGEAVRDAAALDASAIDLGLSSLLLASGARGLGAPGAPTSPSAAARARLLAAIDEPPLRYAPFYARVAELFDLPEETVERELARLKDPRTWQFAGLPGVHNVAVRGGPRVRSAETLLVRFAPGTYFPKHHHTGHEQVFVLEGSYTDSHGVEHRAGELREWPAGTEHSFNVAKSEPCIFASVVFGRRFDSWGLRALAKILGR
jgi:quercetin dioxygenase-like cupin family protein